VHAGHGDHRLWVRISHIPGQNAMAFAVRLKAERIIVEQDLRAPPGWPFPD
jgi:hypothetical protein